MAADWTLDVEHLGVRYGKRVALEDVSICVRQGEAVAVLGHNGAGKSTLLRSVFGLVPVMTGRVRMGSADLTAASTRQRVAAGMAFSPQERFVFGDLTVAQNLELGRFSVRDQSVVDGRLAVVHRLFPLLAERGSVLARRLSGGQQRMLGIALGLLTAPRVLLLDEPSLGLAPALYQEIVRSMRALVDEEGMSVLLVEQNVRRALSITDRAYVIQGGRLVAEGRSADLLARDDLWRYF